MSVFRVTVSFLIVMALTGAAAATAQDAIRVASKNFAEGHLLAEITAQLLEARGMRVERRMGLGGTAVAFEALRAGELDVYPEYTGTLTRAVYNAPDMDLDELGAVLAEQGMQFHATFGFINNYAIAVPEELAEARSLSVVSDLAEHPDLRLGFSHEFLSRGDGWPALQALYDLPQEPSGIDHALAYRALASDHLDVTDAYTTDGELSVFDLRLLEDDRGLFPNYYAGLLVRRDLPAAVLATLGALEGRIDEATMQRLNRRVSTDGESPATVAAEFLRGSGLVAGAIEAPARRSDIGRNTLVHLQLTGLALALACLVAVPLALLVSRAPRLASALQYTAGLIQTIPALALLALLIPLLGLGQATAVLALFLYSLLPIVRNTLTGLASVDPLLKEVATSMGMTGAQQILRIELPLAVPMILAGIRTAAVISIGTATLAAFVGAGGLGEPIITGLSLNDNRLILEGAIPAALLAVAAEWGFELLERQIVPAHLRVRGA
jgi:osmoprotectant transport system permease protein